jgi:phytanoyl-CoA hydroxylase
MLTAQQVDSYQEKGFLHIPAVFSPERVQELARDLDRLMDEWATRSPGWSGPWRRDYMDEETEKASELIAMHDLQLYSAAWLDAVTDPALTEAMAELLGPDVELHHSTMHTKPPETGHPFPMHQDWAFYPHIDERYVDVLVHLDDTCHENGEIRFLPGSHLQGALEHVTQTEAGPCTPHLPTDQYRLADTYPVPARSGDVVCFSIHTIHGSHINQTQSARRMVRVGYRNPANEQTGGQSHGRPGPIVRGHRTRLAGQQAFSTSGPAAS